MTIITCTPISEVPTTPLRPAEAPGPVGDVIARVALHSSGGTRNYPDRSDERTGTEITRPVPDGGLIQNHDVEEQGACLQAGPVHPASPWKVPRAGPSRDLGRQAMEILAARNARSPETGSGVMIHMDMRKAVLVHEFPMNTFGSIAFHGFLSTAEDILRQIFRT